MIETAKAEKLITVVFCILFALISVLLFWKCKIGYANLDEAFYLNIPYRFMQGDKILFEEWSNTQLSALPVLPLLSLYIKVMGSSDGIYLFIRYAYTVCKCVIAVFMYYKLKKYNRLAAMVTSLLFLIFAAYGLMVLSYNSLAIGGLICAVLLMMTDSHHRLGRVSYIMGGISLSIAVMGIPYVAILYIIYLLAVIGLRLCKRTADNLVVKDFFSAKTCVWISAGIGFCVLVFAAYVFKRTSISEILQTLPHIISGDPNHPVKIWWKIIPGYFARIAVGNNRNYVTLVIYAVFAAEFIGVLMDRKRGAHKDLWVLISAFTAIALQITYFVMDGYINHIMFAPNVLAFFLVVLYKENVPTELFTCIWFPGMIFTFLEYIASNTGFSGISSASLVAVIGSAMIIVTAAINVWDRRKVCTVTLSIFMLLTISATLYFRVTYIFWEGGIHEQTELLTSGPQAGILVSEDKFDRYYGILEDTYELRSQNNELKVVFFGDKSLWLAGDYRCAIYSPLGYGITADRSILYEYYEEHPGKIADVIYIENTYDPVIVEELSEQLGMNVQKKAYGYLLEK